VVEKHADSGRLASLLQMAASKWVVHMAVLQGTVLADWLTTTRAQWVHADMYVWHVRLVTM